MIGALSNGRTTDSGSVCEGSTPSAPDNFWPYRLAWSRTLPSHGSDSGSNPDRANHRKFVLRPVLFGRGFLFKMIIGR
jgi:hypothetical protein